MQGRRDLSPTCPHADASSIFHKTAVMLEVPLASSFGLGSRRYRQSPAMLALKESYPPEEKIMAIVKAATTVGLTRYSCATLKAATESLLYPVRTKIKQQELRPGAVEKLLHYCFSSSVERKHLKVLPSPSECLRVPAGQTPQDSAFVAMQDCLLVVQPKLHSGTLRKEH